MVLMPFSCQGMSASVKTPPRLIPLGSPSSSSSANILGGPSDSLTPQSPAGWASGSTAGARSSSLTRIPPEGGGNSIQTAWQVFKDSTQTMVRGSSNIPPGQGGGISSDRMSGPSAAGEAERRAQVEQAAGSKRMGMVRGGIMSPLVQRFPHPLKRCLNWSGACTSAY